MKNIFSNAIGGIAAVTQDNKWFTFGHGGPYDYDDNYELDYENVSTSLVLYLFELVAPGMDGSVPA